MIKSTCSNQAQKTSIVLCTYNGEEFIEEQLNSIAIQTLSPLELIVSDDGSTDETLSIVNRFSDNVNFPVKIINNPVNLGFTMNFISALVHAKGEFVSLCDQDDIWMPKKLQTCQDVLVNNSGTAMVIHSGQIVDRSGVRQNRRYPDIARDTTYEKLAPPFHGGMVPGFALMFRRTVSDALWAAWPHELYREAYARYGNLLGHDVLLCAVARSIGCIYTISDALVNYRIHGGNVTARVESLVPGQTDVSAALKQALAPTDGTYRQMSERWGTEVELLSAAMAANPELEGLSLLKSYLDNQSRMFGLRASLYAEPSFVRRIRLYARMVTAGAYRSRRSGYLGPQSAIKDGAVAAGFLSKADNQ
jgi:glycosyltransferase involved in cell wall biosynthesis